ncbi:MAG: VanW family protein [Meiothermus sp.]|nr:VanW family protein [Meiothermus sp.]
MKRVLLISIGALTGLLMGWVVFERYQQTRIFSGVVAAGVPVGGLTLDAATAKIAETAKALTPPSLTLKAGDQSLSAQPAELGWQADPAATAERAFAVGRRGWGERIAALRGQVEIPLVAKVDEAALRNRLTAIARGLERAPVEAKIALQNGKFAVSPDKNGLALDIQSAIEVYRANPAASELEFFPKQISASVTAASLQPVADRANSLLRPFTLVYTQPKLPGGGKTLTRTLSPAEIAGLLVLGKTDVTLDEQAVSRLVARLARANDRQPVDARYVVSASGLDVRPEVQGWRLNQPQTRKLLMDELLKADLTLARLPVFPKTAQITVADLPKVDTMQLIAEATTYYGGSAWERVRNVHAAAKNLDGYIVPAGGEFNFNDAIGTISPENGFQEALVISGGRTVKGIGGGVCQTSTTAFRALYQAGLPIVERNQHAYRVRWYDPIVGYDAAVYQPYLNLRATNDTPGPLLVRTDFTNSTLTVRLYGIPDGRRVTVSRPTILSVTPHPPAQYIFDTSLRPGQTKQVDWAVNGYRTRITRTIVSASGQTRVEYLNSNFRPWRSVFQVGPNAPTQARQSQPRGVEVVSR